MSIHKLSSRFLRSVRIDADLKTSGSLDGYICQESSSQVLLNISQHISSSKQRAFTWTGPYGSGKSSLGLLLASYLCGKKDLQLRARKIIGHVNLKTLDKAFKSGGDDWLVLPISGAKTPLEELIEPHIHKARAAPKRGRPKKGGLTHGGPKATKVINALVSAANARKTRGGVLVIVDELGKVLEGAAAGAGDLLFLQDLAEAASRAEGLLIFIGILHQSFDQYAARMGRDSRAEWSKIQGRFIDIPLVSATDELVDLLGRAISAPSPPKKAHKICGIISRNVRERRAGTSKKLDENLAACWPMHPATALLLGQISRRRFGQNERSVFSFLSTVEPFGFQEFLKGRQEGAYLPSHLWDYLKANLESSIIASPDGHRWAQAAEAVSKVEARASAQHLTLMKSIALLDLFREGTGLTASPDVLDTFNWNSMEISTKDVLRDLQDWSVVVFRRHLGAYAVYEGSDFNFEDAIRDINNKSFAFDIGRIASLAGLGPIVAKRHYQQTGTLRWFECQLTSVDKLAAVVRGFKPSSGAEGLFVLCVAEDPHQLKGAGEICRVVSGMATEYPVVIGLSQNSREIKEIGAELLALESIRLGRPELDGDVVARRELTTRITEASDQLQDEIRSALISSTWRVNSTPVHGDSFGGLSRIASDLLDKYFSSSPKIFSELVNRNRLSSQSAGAQRLLLHAMVKCPSKPRIGINGYPAEGGLYSTILEKTTLHGQLKDGSSGFIHPSSISSSTLKDVWNATEKLIDEAGSSLVACEKIFEMWRRPPFGIKEGLLPILATAFLLTTRHKLAAYCDGMFRPEVDDFVIDRLLQDHNALSFRQVRLGKHEQHFLKGLVGILEKFNTSVCDAEPLSVARSLVKLVIELPLWTKRTALLSKHATQLRHSCLTASDPHKALFVDALELSSDVELQLDNSRDFTIALRHIDTGLKELINAYPLMLETLSTRMLSNFRIPNLGHGKGKESFKRLRDRAALVRGVTGDLRIDSFAMRLETFTGDLTEMESIAGFSINKPIRDWVDNDVDRALFAITELTEQFLKSEAYVRVKGRKPLAESLAVIVGSSSGPEVLEYSWNANEVDNQAVDGLSAEIRKALNNAALDKTNSLTSLVRVASELMANLHDGTTLTSKKKAQAAE